ncbi:hypothetical protein [Nocardia caishijiensis]|nr:hypothetical protein [Nocardia caishijiensis]
MKKKTRPPLLHTDPDNRPLQSLAATALQLRDAMSATNHSFSIDLDPVIELDGELLIRRTPVSDRIRRVVADPVVDTTVIQPATRWPEHLRSAIHRMKPWDPPQVHNAALDALIEDFARDIENLLGTIRFAAQVETRPHDQANIWADFVLTSRTHLARLALTVDD